MYRGFWKRFVPDWVVQRVRNTVLYRPNDPLNLHQQPPANRKIESVPHIQAYRFPAPGSRHDAKVPHRPLNSDIYDIQQYTRDPRNQPNNDWVQYNTKDESAGYLEPEHPVKMGSKGSKNPAVLAYDPTGLRTTMTASWDEMEKALQAAAPTQLVHNYWHDQEGQIISECETKGIPLVAGKRPKMYARGSDRAEW